jgi:hypothetical protein
MSAALGAVSTWVSDGLELLADAGQRIDVALLATGLALHLLADAVRNRAWFSILRTACPDERGLRVRDVEAAAFAGGGVNGLLPARAGDLLKLALLRRRMPRSHLATLTATLVPETVFELAAGGALLGWALYEGYLPAEPAMGALARLPAPVAVAAGLVAALAAIAGVRALRRRASGLVVDLRAGCAILGRPRALLIGVVAWQLAGRVIRLVAIACCLAACRLPSGLPAALVIMAVEGGTRVRLGPASMGLRLALMSYGLGAVAGGVATATLVTYGAVVRSVRAAAGAAISLVVVGVLLEVRSPRRALAAARALVRPRAEALPAQQPGA